MSTFPRTAGWRAAAVLALFSSSAPLAVAQTPPGRPAASSSGLSWPAPPAPARIRFVRVLTPSTSGATPSRLSRLLRLVTGGSATTPELTQPYGIAVDGAGKVYVTDTYAETIHVFDSRRNRYSSIRVSGRALIGVALLGDNLVITDSEGQRVICQTPRGRLLWSLGKDAGFERPTGLVAAADRVFVVDTSTAKVVTVSASGKVIGAFGSRGGDPGQFNFPTHIARGADGRLIVTDSMNFRIQMFSPEGQLLGGFGRLGDGTGDLNRPKGVAVDSEGHIYVVEGLHDTVQIFDDRGRFLLAFGESGAVEGRFWLPTGIAIRDDQIYVADTANRRVQVFSYLKESQ